ncbi:MAG: MBL fold metallo-hydrolase [Myxococcota bacterium]
MDWSCLGHAMWLVEAAGLRILCDPLLGPEHHSGVFQTVPRRRVRASALRPDFILVSHRHPDHFDVPSLHQLALLDPDSVVVTPDPLVVWAARALGFRTVHPLPPGQRVELDGVRLVTTPSLGVDEWGVMIAAEGAVGWNHVDAVLRGPDHMKDVKDRALAGVEQSRVDLAVVRWQPMLEIAAVLGRRTGFPYATYGDLLAQAAAVEAVAVVPGANGAAHVPAFGWMDRFVFPVPEARFLRDLARVCPDATGLPLRVGGRYRVAPGQVELDPAGAAALIELEDEGAMPGVEPALGDVPRSVSWSEGAGGTESVPRDRLRRYRPLVMPVLRDPNLGGHDQARMRTRVHAWIRQTLADALARAWPGMKISQPLRFVVEVVFPRAHDAFTLHVGPNGTRVSAHYDDDWDLLNVVAGSMLWEVIEARRHWGDVLLAGALRAATRAYAVDEHGLRRADVAEIFLYYGLPYDEAVEAAVRTEVRSLVGS